MKRLTGIISLISLSFLYFNVLSQQLVSVNPDTVYQGTSVWLTIQGSQSHFSGIQAASQVEMRRFFSKINPDSFIVINDTNLKALFNTGSLSTGLYEIRVTTQADGLMRLRNSITMMPNPNAPALLSSSPDTVMQGTAFKLNITAKNSHFYTGSNLTAYLVRGFGQNYQADSARAVSETQMNAWFYFPYSVTTGLYELRVRNDTDGLITLANALTVIPNPNSPALLSITPSQAGQGEAVTFTVYARNTHFLDTNGVYMMISGNQNQLTPDSLKILSDTVFKAYYTIPLSTPLGFYNVQVIDQPDGQLSLNRAIEVIKSANSPDLVAINPVFAYQGDTFVLNIFAINTTFTQSVSMQVNLSRGFTRINPDSVSIINDTALNAYFVLSNSASTGFYNLNVNGAPEGNLRLSNSFEIKLSPTAPQIIMLQPDSSVQGVTVQVYYLCKNTSFLSETGLSASLRRGFMNTISADSTHIINDTALLAYFTIGMGAQTGLYEARISNLSTGTLSLTDAFEIFTSPVKPRIDKFNPLYATQGDQFTLKIWGKYTHFSQGTNQNVNLRMGFGANYNATNVTIVNDTVLDAGFSIPSNAPAGFYSLSVTGLDDGNLILFQAFEIKLAPTSPQILYVSPDEGRVGEQVEVMIYCANTTLTKDNNLTARLSLGWGQNITAVSINVINDTLIKAKFDIPQRARTGKYNVQVQNTSSGTITLNLGFEIKPPLTDPQLVSITPASGKPGIASQLTIKAINTHFTSASNSIQLSLFGRNYSPSSINVVNDTLLTCKITFPADAFLGLYSVNVNNQADGQMSLQQAFQLMNFSLNPHIKKISPDTLYAGSFQSLNIETSQTKLRKADEINIWISHASTIINADSFSIGHDSSLNVYFNLDAKAITGSYDLYLFTDIEDTMALTSSLYLVDTSTSIAEHNSFEFKLYPNPAGPVLQVELDEQNFVNYSLSIYNCDGRLVYQNPAELTNPKTNLNVSGLKPGTYFIVIINNTQTSVQQFIKE